MKNRNISLDIMRIIAALMVLSLHVGQQVGLDDITSIGARGVQLFFIMSGFWGMNSMTKISARGGHCTDYYLSRAKSIMPLYYTILICDYIIGAIFYFFIKHQSFIELFGINGNRGIKYLRYFLFVHSFVPSENYEKWNNRLGLWTMSSFALFYILMPLLFKILDKWQKTALVTIVLMLLNKPMIEMVKHIAASQGFDQAEYFAQSFPLNYLWCFLLGVLIWQIRESKSRLIVASTCILVAILSQMKFHGYEMLFTALVIVACDVPINRYISGAFERIIIKLSDMSFCLYLTHLIVLKVLIRLNQKIGLYGWIGFTAMVIICIVACYLFYHLFEFGKNKIVGLVKI